MVGGAAAQNFCWPAPQFCRVEEVVSGCDRPAGSGSVGFDPNQVVERVRLFCSDSRVRAASACVRVCRGAPCCRRCPRVSGSAGPRCPVPGRENLVAVRDAIGDILSLIWLSTMRVTCCCLRPASAGSRHPGFGCAPCSRSMAGLSFRQILAMSRSSFVFSCATPPALHEGNRGRPVTLAPLTLIRGPGRIKLERCYPRSGYRRYQ